MSFMYIKLLFRTYRFIKNTIQHDQQKGRV